MESAPAKIPPDQQLYDQDFCLWVEQTVMLLREGNLAAIDLEHLLEEIEDMSTSQKQALKSNLKIVLIHLLKYKYQPTKLSNSWLYTLVEHRQRLDDLFQTSPSLKRYFLQELDNTYRNARKLASLETGLSINVFPLDSPFSPEQVLDEDYLPEA